jgi:hypothetical protein
MSYHQVSECDDSAVDVHDHITTEGYDALRALLRGALPPTSLLDLPDEVRLHVCVSCS